MRRILIAAAALSLAGCDLVSGPSRPDVDFQWIASETDNETTAVNTGVLLIHGGLPVPCQPYRLDHVLQISGSVVDLRLIATPVQQTCVPDEFEFIEYAAAIGLRRGTYQVRVHHEWPGTDWASETVLNVTMQVGLTN
jgi:hypothetical protein